MNPCLDNNLWFVILSHMSATHSRWYKCDLMVWLVLVYLAIQEKFWVFGLRTWCVCAWFTNKQRDTWINWSAPVVWYATQTMEPIGLAIGICGVCPMWRCGSASLLVVVVILEVFFICVTKGGKTDARRGWNLFASLSYVSWSRGSWRDVSSLS